MSSGREYATLPMQQTPPLLASNGEKLMSPSAIDDIDSVDDCSHILLVQAHASFIEEEVLVHQGCGAPGHKLVHAAGAVPVVGQ